MRSRRPRRPSDPDSETAARTVALRLLTVRARGAADLARTLERRGFAKPAAESAVERLVREGWLDDLAAARSLVRARGLRYGRARIAQELSALGFSKEVAAEALSGSGEAEQTALQKALKAAWKKSAGLPALARRRRVRAALVRRGFAAAAISAMMKRSHEEEDVELG
ncbi:MAG TPA: regulatory protein RecX [Thermoanaerobaculia bacterium]|nr:regulatory protein RecX [Thermoanaerobaculia bacterium]